jgi:hypothetical protein
MIAIDVSMIPTKDHADTDILTLQLHWVDNHFHDVYAFFKNCVDQGAILNFVDKATDGETDITIYYSTSLENAQQFESKFQDLSAEFSMRKFWNEAGFDTSIAMKEIEFDIADISQNLGVLIDEELKTIWGIDFPSSYS